MLRASLLVTALVAAAPAFAGAKLVGIDVRPSAERVDVVVKASEPLTFQSWARSSPPVLVVDLLDTEASAKTLTPGGAIEAIDVTRHDARGTALSRLSLKLKQSMDYDVTARGNEITVSLFLSAQARDQARAAKAENFSAQKPATVAMNTERGVASDVPSRGVVEGSVGRATSEVEIAQAAEGPRQMTYIGFKNTSTQSRIYARMNAEAKFSVRKEGDNLVVLEIQNATIPLRNNKNHLDTTFFDSPVKMITPSEVEDATPTIRITIEMKEAAPYEAKLEGREVVITFKK
jgi:hypothetical protein